jgi:prophage DNA circulation protein
MALFNQLVTATYNGIPFLVDSSDMKFGRKTQTFEYPGKKYRYVEDLGENLRSFEIDAIITGDDDYLIKRELFIIALQNKGTGVLTHPFYGVVAVIVKSYTITESPSNLGECKIHITFEETLPNILPISGDEGLSAIEQIINDTASYLEAFVITKFSTSFKHNISDAAAKCNKLNASLQPNKPVATTNNVLNDFHMKSVDFSTNLYTLLQNNNNLTPAISDLLDAFNNLGQTPEDQYILNASVYYFGHDDIPIKDTTAERHQRILNRKILNSYVNCLLLEALYDNALQITYLDDQQIALQENDLEEKYQYLMQNNVLNIDVLRRLETLRNTVKRFFNKLKTNTNKVITVTVPKTPLTVLLYRYYAGFDNENEVVALNDLNNVTKISGDIKILTTEAA